MLAAAHWLAGQLAFAGGRVEHTAGHPVVRGEWLGAPGAPTYWSTATTTCSRRVTSAEWRTPPFELAADGDVVRGRGASDDKGPVYIVLKTAQAFVAQEGRPAAQREVPVRGRGGNRQPAPAALMSPPRRANWPPTWSSPPTARCGGPASRRCRWRPRGWSRWTSSSTAPAPTCIPAGTAARSRNPLHALSQILASLHDGRWDGSPWQASTTDVPPLADEAPSRS